jgi:hypothetical protein
MRSTKKEPDMRSWPVEKISEWVSKRYAKALSGGRNCERARRGRSNNDVTQRRLDMFVAH